MKLFGTDGIRAISSFFDKEFLTAFSAAVACSGVKRVAVGRDPRDSGCEIVAILQEKLNEFGIDTFDLGIVPTPLVSFFVLKKGLDLGVVVSASHNPPEYNGLKLFGADGAKASDVLENDITDFIANPKKLSRADVGRAYKVDCLPEYVEHIKGFVPPLYGQKIVLDCANGATAKVAPAVFEALGAKVEAFMTDQSGKDINCGCGATDVAFLQKMMVDRPDAIGFAYDGDGDRVITLKGGLTYDGDWEMCVLAKSVADDDGVVGTVMTNTACERFLQSSGFSLLRSDVGDKKVYAEMRRTGARLGGEKAGHIIAFDFAATGDGVLISALLSAIGGTWPIPCDIPEVSLTLNVDDEKKEIFVKSREIADEIDRLRALNFRVVARPSGTEPKIRLTVEGEGCEAVANAFKIKVGTIIGA